MSLLDISAFSQYSDIFTYIDDSMPQLKQIQHENARDKLIKLSSEDYDAKYGNVNENLVNVLLAALK